MREELLQKTLKKISEDLQELERRLRSLRRNDQRGSLAIQDVIGLIEKRRAMALRLEREIAVPSVFTLSEPPPLACDPAQTGRWHLTP